MPKTAPSAAPLRGRGAPDGYLRVAGEQLLQVQLQHLLSGLDEDAPEHAPRGLGATSATLSGFTEWVDDRLPTLSVGWDWRAGSLRGAMRYRRIGPPRSNLMLVDARGRDLGFDFTAFQVGLWLDQRRWQAVVAGFLSKMYA